MMNTLEVIRARHLEKTAAQVMEDQINADRERMCAEAFTPILQMWDDVKDVSVKGHPAHSLELAPFSTHLRERDSGGSCLQFWNAYGNYGKGFYAVWDSTESRVAFRFTEGTPVGGGSTQYTDVSFKGLKEKFLEFLQSRIPLEAIEAALLAPQPPEPNTETTGPCPQCDGEGTFFVPSNNPLAGGDVEVACSLCHGSGQVRADG